MRYLSKLEVSDVKYFLLLGVLTLSTQAFSQTLGLIYIDITAMSDWQLECQVIEDGTPATTSASTENLFGEGERGG